jgi:hypothetical protein
MRSFGLKKDEVDWKEISFEKKFDPLFWRAARPVSVRRQNSFTPEF